MIPGEGRRVASATPPKIDSSAYQNNFYTSERDHNICECSMVSADIMQRKRIGLHKFGRGSATAVRYRDTILQPHRHLYKGVARPNFIFNDDIACPLQELIWFVNFWKVRIFARQTGLSDLQT
ncbi:hypothetical protein AVEN_122449-1 [Araneus ventricosus]|uniref:Uncharacterized protein n=1 Tax=Araneus ventricosus TaxID=182803 RepID=A0A4Y2FMV2_ARAVE|nr:hypothetical protein AVEN_122449-1 [Araneus ventricosus]